MVIFPSIIHNSRVKIKTNKLRDWAYVVNEYILSINYLKFEFYFFNRTIIDQILFIFWLMS
jgi:hypothetical protein